jgi:FAD/FMN-containing dehydrogenase
MHAQPRLSRRTLLSGSVAGLALPWILHGARAVPAPGISEAAWAKLGGKITGGVLRPNDPRFVALTRPENLRYYHPPATPDAPPDPDAPFAAVRPHNAKEVADAILWAQDVGCRMVPRSGGHSYAGCSTLPGLVIHLGAMRHVAYDPNSSLLEVGGGALNGDVFSALGELDIDGAKGRLTITHGRCRSVGLSAFLMGGGIGLAMRESGLGCDLVERVELVLADGRVVTASERENEDLFWAVRGGGGGNLGIATRWWLRPVKAEKVIAFNASWRLRGKQQAIFTRLVRAFEAAPDRMGAQMSVSATALNSPWPNEISLIGQLRGTLDEFRSILGGAFADADAPAVLELPYWEAQEFFEIESLPNRYQETSLFAGKLSDALIAEAFRLLRTWPGTAAGARLTFFLMGGRVNTIQPAATAFVHRSSQWLINPILEWTDHDSRETVHGNLQWQRKLHNMFSRILGGSSSYQNFPDPALDDHAAAYWGTNLPRLSRVKRAFDHDAMFTPPRNQGIPQPP